MVISLSLSTLNSGIAYDQCEEIGEIYLAGDERVVGFDGLVSEGVHH
jgi:hypothetical protein